MNRVLIPVAFLAVVFVAAIADGQTWMFQPGTYSSPSGPDAAVAPTTSSSPSPSAPQAGAPSVGPHAYTTFTETQALQAARLPKPAFRWDPTGVRGRMMRYQAWGHEEAMEANRLRTYAQGVRDAVGAPLWTWSGTALQPLPRIAAPSEESAATAKPATSP